jgi:glutamate racemase
VIQEVMGKEVTLIDSAKQVACEVKKILPARICSTTVKAATTVFM